MNNSYLTIAKKVLGETQQALSARQILDIAYNLQIVPKELYGRTQHKTLHARLAENILKYRTQSEFARTAPGRFCLRSNFVELQKNGCNEREYVAPVRANQLKNFYVLCIDKKILENSASITNRLYFGSWPIENTYYEILSEAALRSESIYVRVIVVLIRDNEILVLRAPTRFGDQFDGTVSIGLIGFLKRDDFDLFSNDDYGLEQAADRTLSEQLYLDIGSIDEMVPLQRRDRIPCVVEPKRGSDYSAVAAITVYNCVPNSKADKKIAALENVDWHPAGLHLNTPNLDPWSRDLIERKVLNQYLELF